MKPLHEHMYFGQPPTCALCGADRTQVALDAALERERDLRQALLEASYFHVRHDGSPRHPKTCNDCRALVERHALAEQAR